MELINFRFEDRYDLGEIVIAMGEFDGLHIAHQILLKKTVALANKYHVKSAVITFDPHPDFVLKKRVNQGYLTPLNVKIKQIEELGIDYLIVINFTKEFSQITPKDFEANVLDKFQVKRIVVGFDFHYGGKGLGSVATLKEKYQVTMINRVDMLDQKIGSNMVRELLLEGRIKEANKMLGRYYNITGRVESGNKIGQKIGIRTANITLEEEYQLLRKGVYAVKVTLDEKKYIGVCNIGHNPSINYVEIPRLEVHILHFNEMIYDKIIAVDFIDFIRDEKKYDNLEDLIKQIHIDIKTAETIVGDKI